MTQFACKLYILFFGYNNAIQIIDNVFKDHCGPDKEMSLFDTYISSVQPNNYKVILKFNKRVSEMQVRQFIRTLIEDTNGNFVQLNNIYSVTQIIGGLGDQLAGYNSYNRVLNNEPNVFEDGPAIVPVPIPLLLPETPVAPTVVETINSNCPACRLENTDVVLVPLPCGHGICADCFTLNTLAGRGWCCLCHHSVHPNFTTQEPADATYEEYLNLLRRYVVKTFDDGDFYGIVADIDFTGTATPQAGVNLLIMYTDGDQEHMSLAEVLPLLVDDHVVDENIKETLFGIMYEQFNA